jgi:hypothetical protein
MKRKSLFLGSVVFAFLILTFVVLNTNSNAGKIGPPEGQTPTVIPPNVLTSIVPSSGPFTPASTTQIPVHPTFDLQQMYPVLPEIPTSDQILGNKLEGRLADSGILRSIEPPVFLHGDEAGAYELNDLAWEEWTYDSFITVFAGRMNASPSQGIVWVQITPHYKLYQDRLVIPSPVQAGTLSIVGAMEEQLILNSEQGGTFYFDVPSLSFADSLQEKIPPATSIPESPTEETKDAPDIPLDVFTFQQFSPKQVNIPVNSFINSSDDYDWFYFRVNLSGTINVSLVPRSGNYGLKVVLVNENQMADIVAEDTTPGADRKQVTIPNAPGGDYLVRVWSLDSSFSDSQPYILLFNAPEPQRVIPILKCVAENADGTYTAHFGYENPNPFVVVVDAKNHQNKFEPLPTFRTGQPEDFAPGRVTDWFSILFDGKDLTWMLDGNVAIANRNSPGCP